MTTQTTVRATLTTGIVGKVARDGPTRAAPWNLNPAGGSAQPNTIGLAFTQQADEDAEAGGSGVFVGVLMLPNNYALQGTTAGTLEPTIEVEDGTVGELLTMGIVYLNVVLAGAGTVGDVLTYNTTTGIISDTAASGTQIAFGATLYEQNLTGTGLGIVQLTN